jgi:hypothetical protein
MANVISSLLIGIGFQTDEKSAANVEGAIDGIKSKALGLAGLVAGAFGANALTFGFASTYDALGKLGERWDLAAEDITAYDRALQHAGGTAGEFIPILESLTKLQTQTGASKSQFIAGLAIEGVADQVNAVINAQDALEGFLVAADQLSTLDADAQERFIGALGFTDAQVRLLRTGRDGILSAVEAEKKLIPITAQMTNSAALFNDEWQDLTSNVSGISNEVAQPITQAVADIMVGMNDWIDANRTVLKQLAEFSGETIGANLKPIAAALGAALVVASPLAAALASIVVSMKFLSDRPEFLDQAKYSLTQPFKDLFGGEEAGPAGGGVGSFDIPTFEGVSSSDVPIFQQSNQSTSTRSQPIQINLTSKFEMDGKVIDTRIQKYDQEQNDQVIQDSTDSTGG